MQYTLLFTFTYLWLFLRWDLPFTWPRLLKQSRRTLRVWYAWRVASSQRWVVSCTFYIIRILSTLGRYENERFTHGNYVLVSLSGRTSCMYAKRFICRAFHSRFDSEPYILLVRLFRARTNGDRGDAVTLRTVLDPSLVSLWGDTRPTISCGGTRIRCLIPKQRTVVRII